MNKIYDPPPLGKRYVFTPTIHRNGKVIHAPNGLFVFLVDM